MNMVDPTGELLGGDVWNPLGDLVEGGVLLVGGAIVAGGVIAQGGALLKETYNAVVRSLSSTDSTHENIDKTIPQNNTSSQSEAGQEVTGQGQTQTQSQVATASPPPSGGGGKKDDGKGGSSIKSQISKAVDSMTSHADSGKRFTDAGVFKNTDALGNFMKNQATKNLSIFKNGMNDIQVNVNGVITTVRVNVTNGGIQSINAFIGSSARAGVNVIKSTF